MTETLRHNPPAKLTVFFCAYAALIFAAYMQPLNQSVFTPNSVGNGSLTFVLGVYLLAWVAPALPALIALLTLAGLSQIPAHYARWLAVSAMVVGLLLTLASGVFSLFSGTQVLHGVTLTIAVASSFLIWSGRDGKAQPSRLAILGNAVSTTAALWSLLTVPMILIQAHYIAAGSPHCIAYHLPNSPVETLHELRGFSFYTENTGYKSTSEWFFHGLMIVDHPDGLEVYNWSPRRWRFDLISQPDVLIAPVRHVCVPS